MNLLEKIRLIAEYSPLLDLAQQIAAEKEPYNQVLIAFQAIDFLANKTSTGVDDKFVFHVKAILGTEEGREALKALVDAITEALSE